MNGAPCKHQYLLWIKQFSVVSKNFLPFFNAKERQEFSKLAVGVSGPDGLYEGIRDRIHITNATDNNHTDVESTHQEERDILDEPNDTEFEIDSTISQSKKHEADEALDEAFRIIKGKLHTDPNLITGAIKFAERVRGMSNPRLASALHCFGNEKSSYSLKITKAAVRNAKRNKIKVQPVAVKRRKIAIGSSQKQSKRNHQEFRSSIPSNTQVQGKRLHEFAKNVFNNEPVAKKAGRSMASVTKIGRRKLLAKAKH